MIEREIAAAVEDALRAVVPGEDVPAVDVQSPREKEHGDYATTVALGLARALKRAPRDIASALLPALRERTDLFAAVEVAGPGFVNFRLAPARLRRGLVEILEAGPRWGESDEGGGLRVQVEFVSANPTGPLNVVSARAAAFGGVLTRILGATGHRAEAEFYVNDVGRQIDLLGESLLARYRQRTDAAAAIPADGYEGDYLRDLALELDPAETDARLGTLEPADQVQWASGHVVERMLEGQRRDLEAYGNRFDRWFRQHELYPEGVEAARRALEERGHVEERDGAVWFRSTEFGDDQDRVLVRASGEPSYFLADLAYHADKHRRGLERVIDIWGPDHHGYVARMQAGMEALGYGRDWLEILVLQQVNLLSGGEPVKMSKRKGEFVTLRELMDEVGRDTAIFFFMMRRAQSHLDFDLDLAKQQSDENPVYYVKYAHARISGILRKAEEEGVRAPARPDLDLLEHETEQALIKVLLAYPALLAGAARDREPHRLTGYLRDVAQHFHLFYHHCRVVGPDPDLTGARLALTRGARQVLANGLALLGIDAPERM